MATIVYNPFNQSGYTNAYLFPEIKSSRQILAGLWIWFPELITASI